MNVIPPSQMSPFDLKSARSGRVCCTADGATLLAFEGIKSDSNNSEMNMVYVFNVIDTAVDLDPYMQNPEIWRYNEYGQFIPGDEKCPFNLRIYNSLGE